MVVAPPEGSARRLLQPVPLRILTAVPLCDGHDSAVATINLELARAGVEVIYLGYHCPASAIARAAVQEDVQAVGLSSYNGGHRVFFKEVLNQLRIRGAADIRLFGGGGGTITAADERLMKRDGVDRIFFAGTPIGDIAAAIRSGYARKLGPERGSKGDRALGRAITLVEGGVRGRAPGRAAKPERAARKCFVVGVAGPGGAGKSTLIDELTSRFLRRRAVGRLAVVANDPSHPGSGGAVLGDRVSAIYAQDDRVFFRSLATRGELSGLSAAAPGAIGVLQGSGEFDLLFVESVGIGQDGDPFGVFGGGGRRADAVIFVLPPHYGGRIQLQKIAMLGGADIVVLNKCDQPMARTARAEVKERLSSGDGGRAFFATVASRHEDPGTDELYAEIERLAGLARLPCPVPQDGGSP